MASKVPGVQITGGREIRKQLSALGDAAVADLKTVNLEGAEIVLEEALSRVPVGRGSKKRPGGNLRDTVRASATKTRGTVRAGFKKRAPYAGPIHFGWPDRGITPQPFLYESMDVRRNEVERAYHAHIATIKRKHRL
jgi:hypothetical protein